MQCDGKVVQLLSERFASGELDLSFHGFVTCVTRLRKLFALYESETSQEVKDRGINAQLYSSYHLLSSLFSLSPLLSSPLLSALLSSLLSSPLLSSPLLFSSLLFSSLLFSSRHPPTPFPPAVLWDVMML
ncbi:hypothetical protein PAMP_018544 [Pampus punctatissimus]